MEGESGPAPPVVFVWAMRRQDVIRVCLFVVFFSVGATALSSSILCDDLLRYYHNRQMLSAAEESTEKLGSLITDYDVLLQQWENDPNLAKRVGAITLGRGPADSNAVYPEVTPEQLAAARKVLAEESARQSAELMMPGWLVRCSEPRRRTVLFLAGAFLVLVSFMFFGGSEKETDVIKTIE